MIDVAAPILEVPAVAEEYRGRVVPRALCAALIAFAEELEKLAAETREAGRRGAIGKSKIYEECAAMLRGRAAELETHGPISDAAKRRAEALAKTEADAERLRATADDFVHKPPAARAADQQPASINESTALEVGQSEVPADDTTCGIRDEMGYECERKPHPPGTGPHETYDDGSVSCRWPDTRPETPPMEPVQAGIAAYLRGERDVLPALDGPGAPVFDLGPISEELAQVIAPGATEMMPVAPAPPPGAPDLMFDLANLREKIFTTPHVPADALFVVSDIGQDENGNRVIDAVKIKEISVVNPTQDDPFATPATAAEGLDADPFATASAAPSAPWRLPADPRPFAFDPTTALPVPDHVSYSQITTGEACGLQLRLKKRDGVTGQPAYWNVGGTAFHACVELIERVHLGLHAPSETAAGVSAGDLAACAKLFSHKFDEEIWRTEIETGISRDRWRVGGKGAEGDAWWRHSGALMVQAYVAHSDAMRADGWEILNIAGKMVGLELDLNTPVGWDIATSTPVNLNARLDVVWYRWEPAGPTSPDGTPCLHLRIEDGKSGAKPVTDTFQLGLYGHVLQRVVSTDFPPPVVAAMKISAAYYDARTGKSGDAFDPIDTHSWAEIEYRGLTTLAMHSAGVYPANPKTEFGGPCWLCDVRHACPIMAMRD